MKGYQKFTAIGHLGKDAELRYTTSGKAVARFTFAVNEGTGDKKTTEWFTVECWEKLAETVNAHARKGRAALVEGKLIDDSYLKDGVKVNANAKKVRASLVYFLDSKPEAAGDSPSEPVDGGAE